MSKRKNQATATAVGAHGATPAPAPVIPTAVATTPAAAGGNQAAMQAHLEHDFYELGKKEGEGLVARCHFCDRVTAEAKDGNITVDGAEKAWASFQKGAREQPDAILGGVTGGGDELAQRAADLKHYITLGANVHIDGPEVLANARLVLRNMRNDGTAKGLRTWDAMLIWLRKQNAHPERTLTDGEVEELFREKAKRATDELDRLTSARNILLKQKEIYANERTSYDEARELAEAAGENEAQSEAASDEADEHASRAARVQGAIDTLDGCIADLGGTRKDQRKAERAATRARKEAAIKAAKAAVSAAP